MPQIQRVELRVNGVGMLHRDGDPVTPPDPDTVYYTKTSRPHVFDVSFAGPFWPIEAMGEHIHSRCSKEGSLPALRRLHEVVESIGFVGLQHIVAPLPGGEHMTIEVVGEKNPDVAGYLRSCPRGTPRHVYTISKQVLHPEFEQIIASSWPFDYVPTLDVEILKTFLSKEKVNEEAGRIFDTWKTDTQSGDTVRGGMYSGLFLGQLFGPNQVPKQMLTVHMDEGKVDRNGVAGY
jgi:hypothetical protein